MRAVVLALAALVASGEARAQGRPPGAPAYPPPGVPSPATTPASSSLDALASAAGSIVVGVGVARQTVGIGDASFDSASSGLFLHGAGVGSLLGLSLRERVAINLGGGQVGLDTRAVGEVFGGVNLALVDGLVLLLHVGLQGYHLANDEVQASIFGAPVAEVGVRLNIGPVAMAFGPEAGLAIVTSYAPGDEDQGRRFRRKRTGDLAAGGFLSFTWEHLTIDGSFSRITATEPLWVADGNACVIVTPLALCGFAQYWRSMATLAQPGLPLAPESSLNVPTLYVGGAIAIGAAVVAGH